MGITLMYRRQFIDLHVKTYQSWHYWSTVHIIHHVIIEYWQYPMTIHMLMRLTIANRKCSLSIKSKKQWFAVYLTQITHLLQDTPGRREMYMYIAYWQYFNESTCDQYNWGCGSYPGNNDLPFTLHRSHIFRRTHPTIHAARIQVTIISRSQYMNLASHETDRRPK